MFVHKQRTETELFHEKCNIPRNSRQMAAKWGKQFRPFLPGQNMIAVLSEAKSGRVKVCCYMARYYGILKINLLGAANCRQVKAWAERQNVQNKLCSRQQLDLLTAGAVLTPPSKTNVLLTFKRLKTNLCQMHAHVTRRPVGRRFGRDFER